MATHSSVLTWRIPGKGEPGGLPSIGSHRVGHDWSDLAAAVSKYEQNAMRLQGRGRKSWFTPYHCPLVLEFVFLGQKVKQNCGLAFCTLIQAEVHLIMGLYSPDQRQCFWLELSCSFFSPKWSQKGCDPSSCICAVELLIFLFTGTILIIVLHFRGHPSLCLASQGVY